MSSALRVILGVSLLTIAACDGGTEGGDEDNTGGLKAVAGSSSSTAGTTSNVSGTSSSSAGTGNPGTSGSSSTGGTDSGSAGTGTGGTGPLEAGVPLTAADGWVDMGSNTLGIQGAMFAYADPTSKMGLVEDFVGDHACIKGEAAEVDLKCTPEAPAVDCYGQYWGAAIGLNLNQPINMETMEGDLPMPFDASAAGIKGFAFEITGAVVPVSLRFKIENSAGEFCNTAAKGVKKGPNSFLFSDLQATCWKPAATNPTGETAKSTLVKIAWQVVTKTGASVPFDYCVANVRALQ